jgi:hypothetical protein
MPKGGLRHNQHLTSIFTLFRILLTILSDCCFTPFTLSSPPAPRCALVVTGIKDPLSIIISSISSTGCDRSHVPG